MAERIVACPVCRRGAIYGESNPWRPFCSQRCRNVDLGAWASENYRVAATPESGPDVDEGGAEPGRTRPPGH